jgi:Zn-dependent protease
VFAVLTIVSAATSVPYARTGAMMSLVLLASILTPAPPFDGSKLFSRLGQLAVAGGLALASLAFAMKWI